jgi:large subunit ribosomal protein L2
LNNLNKSYRLLSIEYDPCRSAFIGLYLNIESKKLFFDLVNEGQKIGEIYGISESLDDISVGTKMFLRDIPLGTLISSLEIKQGKGSQYLRSAGAYGKVQKKDGNFAFIKMPSKRIIKITLDCMATIGIISNIAHKNKVLAKAGRSR